MYFRNGCRNLIYKNTRQEMIKTIDNTNGVISNVLFL